MSNRKKQRSRLNSLADFARNSKELPSKHKKLIAPPTLIEEKSIDYEDLSYGIEGCEECLVDESSEIISGPLSRTEMLVLDYLQFLAARRIQRFVRGWLCRTRYRRQRAAAIIIQKEWRRFYYQRKYFVKVEEYTQQRIEQHYYKAAQKIQAFWRGWWVRHHVHDHTHLMHMQLLAGEDLLYCVAFKLHHLLRTHQIPGVFSLRNSNTLSKVEQLLSSLSFKTCNHHVFLATLARNYEYDEAKKQHNKAAFGTRIPFTGPDILNMCEAQYQPLFSQKDVDARMAKILKMYTDAQREQQKPKKKKKYAYPEKYLKFLTKSSSFCSDVVKSMQKWKIIRESNLTVDPNIFRKPENLEQFLKEMESKLRIIQGYCYCKPSFDKGLAKSTSKLMKKKAEDETKAGSVTTVVTNDLGSSIASSGFTHGCEHQP